MITGEETSTTMKSVLWMYNNMLQSKAKVKKSLSNEMSA